MLHGLYRVYLYAVYIAMLIFATVGLGMFLQTLLALTIFKDIYNVPTNTDIVQSGTFAVVSWLIAALVGGLASLAHPPRYAKRSRPQKEEQYVHFS